jgi:3-phenylpropionate/trans-cinnamate dioxygenase ferredoxin component
MQYVYAAKVSQLPPEGKMKVTIDGQEILIVRSQGAYYAVDNTCPHMGGSLVEGDLKDHFITCPRHGTVFDVKDGIVYQPGKILMFKVNPNALKSFPVIIEEDNITLGME